MTVGAMVGEPDDSITASTDSGVMVLPTKPEATKPETAKPEATKADAAKER